MINQGIQVSSKNFESWYKNIAIQKYGNFVNYEKIEKDLMELKEGVALTYNHLMIISDVKNWPSFKKWYIWPETGRLINGLKGIKKRLFVPLNDYDNQNNIKQKEIDTELFSELFNVFKSIGLVSIILRFIDPVHYGMYSPPVAHFLNSPRGSSYLEEYLKYLETLRETQKTISFNKVAHVDMVIWTVSKKEEYELEINDKDLDNFYTHIKDITENNPSNVTIAQLESKTRLEEAKLLFKLKKYNRAAESIGKAFEKAITIQCEENRVYEEFNERGERVSLAKHIDRLLDASGMKIPKLQDVNILRNLAAHASGHSFKPEEVELMISTTEKVQDWSIYK